MDWLFDPACLIQPVFRRIVRRRGVAPDRLRVIAVDLHQDASRWVGDPEVQDGGKKTGMNEPGVAEDDRAWRGKIGDAIDAHGDKGYAVARCRCGDHGELEAAVEQAWMEMKLIRGGSERLWQADFPERFPVSPPHRFDGLKHGSVEETAPCRSGIHLVGGEMLGQTGLNALQVQ